MTCRYRNPETEETCDKEADYASWWCTEHRSVLSGRLQEPIEHDWEE